MRERHRTKRADQLLQTTGLYSEESANESGLI